MAYCDCDQGSEFEPGSRGDASANTGAESMPPAIADTGRSPCYGAKPVVQVWQGQSTNLTLYALDRNGAAINLELVAAGSSESSSEAEAPVIIFQARDTEGSTRVRFQSTCTVEDAANGKVTCAVTPSQTDSIPGILVAQLLVYAADGETLLHATPYWFSVNASLDSVYSHCSPITIPEVRLILRDQCGEQNLLLQDFEFDDSQILACMRHPVDEFNEKYQPKTRYTMRTFPWRFHWLRATAGYLLEIAAHGYARDHLPYSAGGVSVDDKNKTETYMRIAKTLIAEWREFVRSQKIELNIEGGYGRMGSSYRSAWYRL